MNTESTWRSAVHEGLEGVRFTRTRLSLVDGEAGRLVVAGHDIEELATTATYERAAAELLALGQDEAPRSDFALRLGQARVRAHAALAPNDAADPMDALRAALGALPSSALVEDIVATTAVVAAGWARRRVGGAVIAPSAARSHAEDYLVMATGRAPAAQVRALDAYLVTVLDHGMNASTFAARVVASTASDRVSAVTAALGALKGPLHGGAPGPVLDMLDAIGREDAATDWLEGELRARRRIMGMGHRVYRVRDPRAAVLEKATLALEAAGVTTGRLALARAVERAATTLLATRYPDRPLKANVEFYTAVLLDTVGLPRELFTPTFAVGRVAGWCAHFDEQRRTGRLVRPDAEYIGALPTMP